MFISSIILQGGLGNQLFQIFTLYAYSLQYNYTIYLSKNKEDSTSKEGYPRPTYWDTILKPLKPYLIELYLLQNTRFYFYAEPEYSHRTLPTIKNNIMFSGYFQSYKYFEKHSERICEKLQIRALQEKVSNTYMEPYMNNEIVSIHFRIGDYKNIQDFHNILEYSYYEQCIQEITTIKDNLLFIYFYEEEDSEHVNRIITNLKQKFKNKFISINTDITDWEQLLCMSCCNHNIIANSSFSWWGAYFNKNTEKKIYYPSQWFGKKLSYHNTNTLCPDTWIKIDC